MASTKLEVLNLACDICRAAKLSTLTQNSMAGRVLRSFYDHVVDLCLEEGDWAFARLRTQSTGTELGDDDAIPFKYSHALPSDFIRLSQVRNEDYDPSDGSIDYDKAEGYLYTNEQIIDYAYISTTRGRDPQYWPPAYVKYVAHELAVHANKLVPSRTRREEIKRDRDAAAFNAKSIDRSQRAPRKPPTGSWVNATRGRRYRIAGI